MFFDSAPAAPARASITCGHCRRTHTAVDIVRACSRGWDVIAEGCGWLVEGAYFDFDGFSQLGECRAELAEGPDAWICAAGHEHVGMATREAQGWDYAENAYDAAVILRGGRDFRPMGAGTSIDSREVAEIFTRI